MDKAKKKELLAELKRYHDIVHEHPYWISFEPSEWPEMKKYFIKMMETFLAYYRLSPKCHYGNKEKYRMLFEDMYTPVLNEFIHDNYGYLYTRIYEDRQCARFGEMIQHLQSFISGIHSLLEQRDGIRLHTKRGIISSKFIPLGTDAGYWRDPKESGWYFYYELTDKQYENMIDYFQRRVDYLRSRDDYEFSEKPVYDELVLDAMKAGTFYYYEREQKDNNNE